MKWSRRHTLVAGIGLIIAVNVIALVGVAYNRSGEPESLLRLSERELRRPHQIWGFGRENSGLALKLQWRVRTHDVEKRDVYHPYIDYYGDPVWLDRAKLAELGVNVLQPMDNVGAKRGYQKLPSKEVFLVLELDGQNYQAAVDIARERAARDQARAAANPGDSRLKSQAEMAAKQLELEQTSTSRLFVIDAGLDAQALRTKYLDRARYAIVHGRIQPRLVGDDRQARLNGYIEALSIDRINVPLELRAVVEGAPSEYSYETPSGPGFEATVAHGTRFEPWLVSAARKAP
jgi:hypothetical protein